MTDDFNMLTGMCGDGFVRIVAADTTAMVQRALDLHNTSPVATAALGRFLTGCALLSKQMKNPTDIMTMQIRGRGPIGSLTAVGDSNGNVRGYCREPHIDMELRPDGKLDVGGAVGAGTLTVIKDLGLKEPYGGTVELISGEIAEDIAYYLSSSEQVPSVVALGVLAAPRSDAECGYGVAAAGGYMLQLMPGAPESLIDDLERRVSSFLSVTTLLNAGATIFDLCEDLLRGLDFTIQERSVCRYLCNCSRERMVSVISSLSDDEKLEMIEQDHGAEIVCHFCNSKYKFGEDEIRNLLTKGK